MLRWWVVGIVCLLVIGVLSAQDDLSPIYIADGFDAPIGTSAERHSEISWSAEWVSHWEYGLPQLVNGTLHYDSGMTLYADNPARTSIHAAASGMVIFAHESPLWDGVIILYHDPLYRNDGQRYLTRYRYLQHINVSIGQRVERGEVLGSVTDVFAFDVSINLILAENPLHTPTNEADLLAHYVHPRQFITAHRPREPQQTTRLIASTDGVRSQGFTDDHPGLDLDAPVGQVVIASTEGVVITVMDCDNCRRMSERVYPCEEGYFQDVGWGYGYGKFVIVRYAAVMMPPDVRALMERYWLADAYVYVLYAHLSQVTVAYGDMVERGTQIGLTGETGCTSAPALHIEVRIGDDEAVNGIWLDQYAINPRLVFDV
jgi:murein DD-endopeptidase MepM/ murein hydrolase activator NlpD